MRSGSLLPAKALDMQLITSRSYMIAYLACRSCLAYSAGLQRQCGVLASLPGLARGPPHLTKATPCEFSCLTDVSWTPLSMFPACT